jgi:hypothetical protein
MLTRAIAGERYYKRAGRRVAIAVVDPIRIRGNVVAHRFRGVPPAQPTTARRLAMASGWVTNVLSHLNERYREREQTRTYGGVGGAGSRGSPLSRSLTHLQPSAIKQLCYALISPWQHESTYRNSIMSHRSDVRPTKAITTRRALLLAFPAVYTSGPLRLDCLPELSDRRASHPDAEIPKILSSAVPSRFRVDALGDGQPSL